GHGYSSYGNFTRSFPLRHVAASSPVPRCTGPSRHDVTAQTESARSVRISPTWLPMSGFMTLWFAVALMTVAAIFAVLWPLARPAARFRSGNDVAVYRDQLDEIERDRAAGLIADKEAAAAQVEVSRRLIAAADAQASAAGPAASSSVWRRRTVAIAALVLLPFGAAG